MRKQQLFALALAGVLTLGSGGSLAFAEAPLPEAQEAALDEDLGSGAEVIPEETPVVPEAQEEVSPTESTEETPEAEEPTEESPLTAANEQELLAAIAAAPEKEEAVITLTADIVLTASVLIPKTKSITLTAGLSQVSILRNENFLGDLFTVEGRLSLVKGTEDPSGSRSLILNGSLPQGLATGSLLRVMENASLTLDETVTLTGNKTTSLGGGIYNSGTVVLTGGTIHDCSAALGGGVYNEGTLSVDGTVNVSGNTGADGVAEDEMYHTDTAVYAESGIPSDAPDNIPTLNRVEGPAWLSANSAAITCVSDVDGWYYAATAEADGDVPIFNVNETGTPIQGGEYFTVVLEDIQETNPVLYVLVKSTDNRLSAKKTVALNPAERPGAAAEEATVPEVGEGEVNHPLLADIKQTEVIPEYEEGDEGVLKFYPGKYYKFSVLGAGNEAVNPRPEEGDIKWVPISYQIGNEGEQKVITDPTEPLLVGFEEGLYDTTAPVPLIILMDKYEYKGGIWEKQEGLAESFQYDIIPVLIHVAKDVDPEDSTIVGLEEPLKFFDGSYYDFDVLGAGEDNEDPGEGDVRYIPLYWTFEKEPTINDPTQHIDWQVGFEQGIYEEERTMTMTIYLTKEVYFPNGDFGPDFYPVDKDGNMIKTDEEGTPIGDQTPYVVSIDRTVEAAYITEEDIGGDVTPTPAPIISNINDSVVNGLSAPLKLYPKTYYPFSVTGAGSQLVNPPEGSTRWVPLYWTSDANNAAHQKSWQVGSASGVSTAKTISIRIYLQEQIYRGGQWVNSSTVSYIKAAVQTEAYDPSSITPTPYQGADGNYYYADGTFAYTAEEAAAMGVATGDETPVLALVVTTLLALGAAAFALLMRRRRV